MRNRTRDIIRIGTRANQPLANEVLIGCLYAVTDEDIVERSNGTIWEEYVTAGVAEVTQAELDAGLATKQDSATAATDAELAAEVATLVTSIATKLNKSGWTVGGIFYIDTGGNVVIDTSKMFIDSVNSRVGFGIAAPTGRIHIHEVNAGVRALDVSAPTVDAAARSMIRMKGYNPSIEFLDKDGVQNFYFGIHDDDGNLFKIGRGYGPAQGFKTLVFDASDNIGIGTNPSASRMHVLAASSDPVLKVENTNAAVEVAQDIINGTPYTWRIKLTTDNKFVIRNHTVGRDEILFKTTGAIDLANQYKARIYGNSSVTIPNNAWSSVNMVGETIDTGNLWSVSLPDRITIPSDGAGMWLFTANIFFTANATGFRGLRFRRVSDGLILALHVPISVGAGLYTSLLISNALFLAGSDVIILEAYQNSGGDLTVNVSGNPGDLAAVKLT